VESITKHNIRFEEAVQRQHDGGDHNRRETPLFAASIERLALGQANRGISGFLLTRGRRKQAA
jgi:hypothetical protein